MPWFKLKDANLFATSSEGEDKARKYGATPAEAPATVKPLRFTEIADGLLRLDPP